MNNHNIAVKAVKKISEMLKIPSPEVYIKDSKYFPNINVSSMYLNAIDSIVFNESWIKDIDSMEVVATAIHETRHAYQAYCVKHHVYESDETIQAWKDSFEYYVKPIESLDPKDHTDYLNQSIEIDAIAFAYQIMLHWFELKLMFPDTIKDKVLERVTDIKVKLTMN
jgi:hypothetical protein